MRTQVLTYMMQHLYSLAACEGREHFFSSIGNKGYEVEVF